MEKVDCKFLEVIDAALEFHKNRASIQALDSFLYHLRQEHFTIEQAQKIQSLNPNGYSLSWQVNESSSSSNEGEQHREGSYCFSLELRAKGNKKTRLNVAKKSLEAKETIHILDLPPLPALRGEEQVTTTHKPPPSSTKLEFHPNDCIEYLKKQDFYQDQIVFTETIEAKKAEFAQEEEMEKILAKRVLNNLKECFKIKQFYRHQMKAISSFIQENKNVLLLSGTGSGKTLCFAAIVAQLFAIHRGLDGDVALTGGGFLPTTSSSTTTSRTGAIFLYPTKALAQDQLRALRPFFEKENIKILTIDGDSTPSERENARLEADILLTNPDFLHVSILPNHRKEWNSFLSKLSLVVMDEAHVFNGAFGSHVSLVLRRLSRILSPYHLRFFLCSATISNPEQTFHRLIGISGCQQEVEEGNELEVIHEDTSPKGERLIMLWRPKLRNQSTMKRCSAIFETARVFASMVQYGARTLAFCRTRKLVELVLKYTHDILKSWKSNLKTHVVAYRAGYTKQERREIEKKMFSGQLLGIACTSALELGIDIGNLDCVIILGIPGSSSTRQMFGRAGRGGKKALNCVVTFEGPLDALFLRNPRLLLDRKSEESAIFDPLNEIIVKRHLLCAAKEQILNLEEDDLELFGEGIQEYVKTMLEDDLLVSINKQQGGSSQQYYRIQDKVSKPHDFSLRVVDSVQIRLLCSDDNKLLDEIEYSRAFFELYPGAIYLHQSRTYCVTSLDLSLKKEAKCSRVDVDYYTSPLDRLDIRIIKVFEENDSIKSGVVRLTWNVIGYKKRRFMLSGREEETEDDRCYVYLPPLEYTTRATWIDLEIDKTIDEERWNSGLHGAQHLIVKTLSSLILSHVSSIGTTHSIDPLSRHRLIIFDRDPGGIGIADATYERISEIITLSHELLIDCECENGCLDCILDQNCSEFNSFCDKRVAIQILEQCLTIIKKLVRPMIICRSTPERKRFKHAKSLARARADGATLALKWKRHLSELGSESVEFQSEL